MKTIASIFNANLTRILRTSAVATALILAGNLAFAQEPKPDRLGGGSGLTFNYGGIFNALKKAVNKNDTNSNAKQPPVLQKRAESVSAVSGGNYTVNWVVSYSNTSGQTLPTAQVQDGPIATIIPGSLKHPVGWTGATNTNSPINNWATWTGTNVQPHGVMTATFPPAGSSTPLGKAGQDGYIPIPYNSPNFGPRIYIFNHGPTSGSNFQCGDASGACPGWPKSAPVGDNSGEKFLSFSGTNEEFGILNGRIYYPVNKASNFTFGIACFDLESETECGYTPLGRTKNIATPNNLFPNIKDESSTTFNTANLARDALLKGPWVVNNELYFADMNGNVYCAIAGSTLTPCAVNYYLPASTIKLAMPVYDVTYARGTTISYAANQHVNARVVNGKIYFATHTRVAHIANSTYSVTPTGPDGKAFINCLNASSKTVCWNNPPPSGSPPSKGTGPYAYTLLRNGGDLAVTLAPVNNFIYYDTSGTAKALCQYLKVGAGSFGTSSIINSKQCFDLSTGSAYTPSGTVAIFTNPPQYHGYGTEVHIWPRTFFPDYATTDVHCWNWQTNSSCDSSSKNYFAKTALFGDPKNYALNVDENQCVWAYGDAGFLWNFDPNNLDKDGVAKPCGGSGKFTKIFKPLEYCSGPKPFHWTGVEIKSATLSNFDKFIAKVLDSTTNAVLMTKDLKATNATSVDTTSIDTQTLSKPFKIEVESTPKAGTSDKPSIEVRFDAPAPEFCFQSTHTCQQSKIINTVEATDPLDPKKTVKAQAEVAQPQSCGIPLCVACGTAGTPTCPPCGQAGQEPCPVCDCVIPPNECKPGSPLWPACQPPTECKPGSPLWPACQPPNECKPGSPLWPACQPPTECIPGSPDCPTSTPPCKPGTPGWPLCKGAPPPAVDTKCLLGDCEPKAAVSIGEEYKEPKVACVRKPKPVAEEPKKVVAPKPRLKPVVVAAPVAVDPNAPPPPPKPKPKPRPKPVPAKPAAEDDC